MKRRCVPSSVVLLGATTRISRIRLVLVDPHQITKAGIRTLLSQTGRIKVIGEAASMAEAVEHSRRLKPDLVLMELRLPDGSGIEACREIHTSCPGTQVLIFTNSIADEAIVAALRAGAAGFLLKSLDGQDLIRAIELAAKGQTILDGTVTRRVLQHLCGLSVATCGKTRQLLSPQEKRVMELVTLGKTNKEIATALKLSDKTVKNYLGHAYEKLRASRRAQATVSFLELMRDTGNPSLADLGCPLLTAPPA